MTDAITKIKPKFNVKEPSLYNVVYINDEVTTVEFVINSLMEIFHHTSEMAQSIADEIHTQGSGIAAVLSYEIAEQKGMEVTHAAREQGFPLSIKLSEA